VDDSADFRFVLFLACSGWSSWYPGAEPEAADTWRKEFSARKTKRIRWGDALVQHRTLCAAPVAVDCDRAGALALYSPHGGLTPSAAFEANHEQGYVMVLRDFLRRRLRGLMVAAFLAAFMSTIGTQLTGERRI